MDEKRSRKRKNMSADEGYWDCSMCTYRNSPEDFKCEICDVRKGTSTRSGRKTRVNPEVVMQQYGQQVFSPPLKKEKKEGGGRKSDGAPKKEGGDGLRDASTSKENSPKTPHTNNKKPKAPRLKNIDRSTARSMEVTVNNITVVITDYQPKKPADSKPLQSSASSVSSAPSLSPSSTTSSTMNTTSSPSKPSSAPSEDNKPSKTETTTPVVNGTVATKDES